MSSLIAISGRPRQRRRHQRRSAEEKASYLAAFRRSGLSGAAFCEAMDVPRSTLARWQGEAREAGTAVAALPRHPRVAFARVDGVVPSEAARGETGEAEGAGVGIRIVVRGVGGQEAALDGVDRWTAVCIVERVLGVLGPRP